MTISILWRLPSYPLHLPTLGRPSILLCSLASQVYPEHLLPVVDFQRILNALAIRAAMGR